MRMGQPSGAARDSEVSRHSRSLAPLQRGSMSRTKVLSSLLLTLTLAVYSVERGYAQIGQASLQGVVRDNSGGVIPGASVSLKSKGTGAVRTVTSDAAGQYFIPNIDPAEYSLTVGFQGFKTSVVSSVTSAYRRQRDPGSRPGTRGHHPGSYRGCRRAAACYPIGGGQPPGAVFAGGGTSLEWTQLLGTDATDARSDIYPARPGWRSITAARSGPETSTSP